MPQKQIKRKEAVKDDTSTDVGEADSNVDDGAFKNFFDAKLLKRIGASLSTVAPGFRSKEFLALAKDLGPLEMKARVRLIRDELKCQLPDDYLKALRILLRSVKGRDLHGFDLWPYTEWIQTYGLAHREESLEALKIITPLFTAEFAVRPFLIHETAPTLGFLLRCARDPDVNVRRWASEGSRPRLPWGERLTKFVQDPDATAGILEALKFDPELYVRKSVANHLNDIAKDHPDWVLRRLKSWQAAALASPATKRMQNTERVGWITRHALRTLIKRGHPGALGLIGVSDRAQFKLSGFKISAAIVQMDERLHFEFRLESEGAREQKIVVDYLIHFRRANGAQSAKVFKLKTLELAPKGSVVIAKTHHFKHVTTRSHYPGEHRLDLQVNGKVVASKKFELRG